MIKPKEKPTAEEVIAAVKEEDEELGAIIEAEVQQEVKDITESIPLAKYGFGIETYIKLLFSMAKMFFVFAILAFVISYMYRSNGKIKANNFM